METTSTRIICVHPNIRYSFGGKYELRRTDPRTKKIAQIKNLLRGQRRYRDLLLFVVGINTALRISGLLQLRIVHLVDDQHHTLLHRDQRGKICFWEQM